MIPGAICLSVASIIVSAFCGKSLPMLIIFPSLIKISLFFKIPSFAAVHIVAFLNNTVFCWGFTKKPNGSSGLIIAKDGFTNVLSFSSDFFSIKELSLTAVQPISLPVGNNAVPRAFKESIMPLKRIRPRIYSESPLKLN